MNFGLASTAWEAARPVISVWGMIPFRRRIARLIAARRVSRFGIEIRLPALC